MRRMRSTLHTMTERCVEPAITNLRDQVYASYFASTWPACVVSPYTRREELVPAPLNRSAAGLLEQQLLLAFVALSPLAAPMSTPSPCTGAGALVAEHSAIKPYLRRTGAAAIGCRALLRMSHCCFTSSRALRMSA